MLYLAAVKCSRDYSLRLRLAAHCKYRSLLWNRTHPCSITHTWSWKKQAHYKYSVSVFCFLNSASRLITVEWLNDEKFLYSFYMLFLYDLKITPLETPISVSQYSVSHGPCEKKQRSCSIYTFSVQREGFHEKYCESQIRCAHYTGSSPVPDEVSCLNKRETSYRRVSLGRTDVETSLPGHVHAKRKEKEEIYVFKQCVY